MRKIAYVALLSSLGLCAVLIVTVAAVGAFGPTSWRGAGLVLVVAGILCAAIGAAATAALAVRQDGGARVADWIVTGPTTRRGRRQFRLLVVSVLLAFIVVAVVPPVAAGRLPAVTLLGTAAGAVLVGLAALAAEAMDVRRSPSARTSVVRAVLAAAVAAAAAASVALLVVAWFAGGGQLHIR